MLDLVVAETERLNRIRLGDLYNAQLSIVREQHPEYTEYQRREAAMQNVHDALTLRIRELAA